MLGKLNLNVMPKVNYLVYDKTEIQAQDATQEQKSPPVSVQVVQSVPITPTISSLLCPI